METASHVPTIHTGIDLKLVGHSPSAAKDSKTRAFDISKSRRTLDISTWLKDVAHPGSLYPLALKDLGIPLPIKAGPLAEAVDAPRAYLLVP